MDTLPPFVREVLDRLTAAGYEAFLVGGCVRDRLQNIIPADYDVASSALPEQVRACFPGHTIVAAGEKHGTLGVVFGKQMVEITTFRADGTYSDRRRPDDVRFLPHIQGDLSRRDFTVNAMALSPDGTLLDPYGGREDLRRRLIRCVGDPETRFREDALRLLRALRFASQLSFNLHVDTEVALCRCAPLLREVAPERVRAELLKLLLNPGAERVLLRYADVLGVVLPELPPLKGFDQRNAWHAYDVLTHTARAVAETPPEPVLRLAALFHDMGKPDCFTVDKNGVGHFYGHPERSAEIALERLTALRLDRATIDRVCRLIRNHDHYIPATEAAVRRRLSRMGPEDFDMLCQLQRSDTVASGTFSPERLAILDGLASLRDRILAQGDCLTLRDLAVDGDDLLSMGFLPGKTLGDTLDRLLEQVLDGTLPNDRAVLLRQAEEWRDEPLD